METMSLSMIQLMQKQKLSVSHSLVNLTEPFLCLADYLKSVDSGEMDYVAFMQVTAGHGVREAAAKLKEQGKFLESHALQATALRTGRRIC